MNRFIAVLLVLSVVGPALAQDVSEPRFSTKFAAKNGDTSLLGVGLRTKTFAKIQDKSACNWPFCG